MTTTGLRACGQWLPPATLISSPPVTLASALASAWAVILSFGADMTNSGQRVLRASAVWWRRVSGAASSPSVLAIMVAASVACAHPIASSICFVEWGALNMRRPMNHSRKSS